MLLLGVNVVALGVLAVCSASRHKRIVGGYPALVPDANGFAASQPVRKNNNDKVVFVEDDYRTATVTGHDEPDGYVAYKGIRYAEPPVGKFRFQVSVDGRPPFFDRPGGGGGGDGGDLGEDGGGP